MKIDAGRTPIWVHERDNGVMLMLMQGSSHIKLSEKEICLLIRALTKRGEVSGVQA